MDSFDHIIITRFNLVHGFSKKNAVNDPNWLEERFYLFEKYCLPSVKSQSFQDFVWLIFFDENLPEVFRDKLDEYCAEYKNIKPIFMGPFEFDLVRKACLSHCKSPFLITSRLDSDDIIGPEFVRTIQEHFNSQKDTLINLNTGFCYDSQTQFLYRVNEYRTNPFMSYIEERNPTEIVKTVFIAPHDELKDYHNMMEIRDEPHWVIVIHNNNVINKLMGKVIYPTNKMKQQLPFLTLSENRLTFLILRFKNLISTLTYFLKKAIKSCFK
ncbi:MAG: glycosyltransferase [Bacteroidota bacterium]